MTPHKNAERPIETQEAKPKHGTKERLDVSKTLWSTRKALACSPWFPTTKALGMTRKWGKTLFGDDKETNNKEEVVQGVRMKKNVDEYRFVESRSLVVPNSAVQLSFALMHADIVHVAKR